MFGENFPYTNFHDLNLDWIIKTLKEILIMVSGISTTIITVADPLDWDITRSYAKFTIVKYENSLYVSTQDVPGGTPISNTDYWTNALDLDAVFDDLKEAITFTDDDISGTATETRYTNQLLWLRDTLYRVLETIPAGQPYTSSNIEQTSIEEWALRYFNNFNSRITALENGAQSAERKVIIIGDSYGMRQTPNYLSLLMQQMPTTYTGVALSGYGFTNGTFYNEFDDFIAALPSGFTTTNVTDVVFAGGWNDARELKAGRQTQASLLTTIRNTCTHAHEVCPNAKIHTCFMAWHNANSVQNQVDLDTLITAQQCYQGVNLGFADSLDDVQYVMRFDFFMDDSYFHPNTAAAPVLATALHNNLFAGSYNFQVSTALVSAHMSSTGVLYDLPTIRIWLTLQKGLTKIKSVPFTVRGTMTGNVVCQFKPGNMPIVIPDDQHNVYLCGWFKGTAGGTTYSQYVYAMLIYYYTGELKMFVNGTVAADVDGTVIIDASVDNTYIK